MSARRLISTGSIFEAKLGYSRAVVEDGWVFVSGCTGWDYARNNIADDAALQTRQTFRNIEDALARAGAALADVVRFRLYVDGRETFERAVPVIHEYFGSIRPANTTVIAHLIDPRMKVEIEVTARIRAGSGQDAKT